MSILIDLTYSLLKFDLKSTSTKLINHFHEEQIKVKITSTEPYTTESNLSDFFFKNALFNDNSVARGRPSYSS